MDTASVMNDSDYESVDGSSLSERLLDFMPHTVNPGRFDTLSI